MKLDLAIGKDSTTNEDVIIHVNSDNPVIYISGVCGSGKTVLSQYLMQQICTKYASDGQHIKLYSSRRSKYYSSVNSMLIDDAADYVETEAGRISQLKEVLGDLTVRSELLKDPEHTNLPGMVIIFDEFFYSETDYGEQLIKSLVEKAKTANVVLIFVGQAYKADERWLDTIEHIICFRMTAERSIARIYRDAATNLQTGEVVYLNPEATETFTCTVPFVSEEDLISTLKEVSFKQPE